jgi:hypothetical protein
MPIDTAVLTTLTLTGLGALVWLIRLEGRINTGEALHTELKEDLRYIRDRIDRALHGRHE